MLRRGLWFLAVCSCQQPSARGPAGAVEAGPNDLLAVIVPECAGQPSLREALLPQEGALRSALANHPASHSASVPAARFPAIMKEDSGTFRAAYLAGHGKVATGDLCYPLAATSNATDYVDFEQLAATLPAQLHGAVWVINTCYSAEVDPRHSGDVPLSVIAASPYSVKADSLFGEAVASALEVAMRDPNCDGLVTDQEWFDAMLQELAKHPSVSREPAIPKLRRNANSEIPLPTAPVPRAACQKEKREMEELVRAHADAWGDFGKALVRQLELAAAVAAGKSGPLPNWSYDFFEVSASDATARAEITNLALTAGLQPLPDGAARHSELLARFMIFAQLFTLREHCGWVDVVRARDGVVLTTRMLNDEGGDQALARALPRRVQLESPARFGRRLWRVHGQVPRAEGLLARPCYGATGQCFCESSPGTGQREFHASPGENALCESTSEENK